LLDGEKPGSEGGPVPARYPSRGDGSRTKGECYACRRAEGNTWTLNDTSSTAGSRNDRPLERRTEGDPATGRLRLAGRLNHLQRMQRVFRSDEQLLLRREAPGRQRRAHLPDELTFLGAVPLPRRFVLRRHVPPERLPVVTDQPHEPGVSHDADRVPLLLAAVVPVRVEVVEPRLHVGDQAAAVVHQDHRVVLGHHLDLALAVYLSGRRDD